MIHIDLKTLVDKMSPYLRDSLEGAAALCLNHAQYNVELEHWLLTLLEHGDCDYYRLLELHQVDPTLLATQLTHRIERFKTGSSRPAALAPNIVDACKNAWMLASIDGAQTALASGHLLAAVLLDDTSRRQLLESCPALDSIAPESLRDTLQSVFGSTAETRRLLQCQPSPSTSTGSPNASKTPALDKYTINLTQRARTGAIDPVLGRDGEIRQCIDILTRRRQNNPIITGEAGVGKTAVVEGFALRIAAGDVPEPLRAVSLLSLDLGLLQAGASVKGEFENRLNAVIEEVRASPTPIVLFIDEAHTLIGAGGKEGQGDAANLLKPALARGELRTIAATTWGEYKKYFERDPALTRRFQVVKVEEPSEALAIEMMRGIASTLQDHHGVRLLDEAIIAAVQLSHRYIPARQLPDKAISLLDTACARVALSQSSTPAAIEAAQRRSQNAATTLAALEREHAATDAHAERIDALYAERATAEQQLSALQSQYTEEAALISEIRALRDQIETQFLAAEDQSQMDALAESKTTLHTLHSALKNIQTQAPLMQAHVDEQAIAEVIANWTGIPVGKMVGDQVIAVQSLAARLAERVIGQPHALEAVAQAIRTSRAGLTDPRKPVGVFLFCGTSGVGKTETALALAEQLFGGEQSLTTINMSEFKEEHKVSMLLGSPPGYVGFGEGGILTEAARRKPYSVILLDEMEKAHPGVQDIFYNLFDKGCIKDGEGRDIDFKNCVIIMTSNAGEDAIHAIFNQVEEKPAPDVLLDNIRPHLLQHFKPAFMGRAQLVPFYPLEDAELMKICVLAMKSIAQRVRDNYGASFSYHDDVLINIVARCQEADTGARNIDSILNRTLLPALASQCLQRMADAEPVNDIYVGARDDGEFTYCLS